MTEQLTKQLSMRTDKEFRDWVDTKAQELGLSRSQILRAMIDFSSKNMTDKDYQ